jgi:hypothetical protein
MATAMGVQQTILWILMRLMTGATGLGATEPQSSIVEPVTSSVEASRGVEWRADGVDPRRSFHDGE